MAGVGTMILDTCALLWLANGDKKLSRSVLKQISEAPAIFVSAISAFEIALKAGNGKLKLPLPAEEWFQRVVEEYGLTVLPLDLQVCIKAVQLPSIHNDPYDRFIIATAIINNFSVVTADERFEEYGVTVLN